MWACLNDGFLSLVADRNDPNRLLVRARRKEHLTNVFPKAEVFSVAVSDYKFRALISRAEVAAVVTDRIMGIKYDNFKNSVKDDDLHNAYNSVWSVMYRLQDGVKHVVSRVKAK